MRRLSLALAVLASLAAVAATVACGGDEKPTPAPTATARPAAAPAKSEATSAVPKMLRKGDKPQPPSGALDKTKKYFATFKTEGGDFKIELFADKAPLTVENFVNLARIGYYDNTTFHRVLDNFMAQGGDPTGTGSSGPGYRFKDEFHPALTFDAPGILAMANSGPGTNGSQFFITFVPTPHLNNLHTIFGKVTEGLDVALKIKRRDPGSAATPGQKILTVEIEER